MTCEQPYCVRPLDHDGPCRSYPNERDCEHGAQRGKCDTCDADSLRAEVDALRQRAEYAEARLASISGVTRQALVERAVRATIEEAALQAGDYVEDANLCGVPCRDEVSAIDAHLRNIDPAPIVRRVLGGGE